MNSKEKNSAIIEVPQEREVTTIEVHLPGCMQIDLVQANELRHYEVAFGLSSLFLSASVGFWTAFITASTGRWMLFIVSSVFSLFTIVFWFIAYHYRLRLRSGKIVRKASLDNFK